MFQTRLKWQNKFRNIHLRKSRENTGLQVRDTSWVSMGISLFIKILLLVIFAIIILFPFFFMLSVSLMSKDEGLVLKNDFHILPRETTWNFWEAIHSANGNYFKSFGLTLGIVIFSIVVKILITIFAGYAFSLKKWRFKELIWAILIALLVLPEVSLLTGQYIVAQRIHDLTNIKNNHLGAIVIISIPFVASVFNAYMFRSAFEAIPGRIKEVALVDGAVGFKYLFKVAIPMVSPTTLTIVILTAIASWNTFLWPSLLFRSADDSFKVMSVWLFDAGRIKEELGDGTRLYWNVRMAGVILSLLPMMIIYFIFRKRIMAAVSRQGSAIKG